MLNLRQRTRLNPILIVASLCLSLPLFAQFTISDAVLDRIEKKYNKFARQRVVSWQELMATSKGLSEPEKLKKVNQFFNANVMFMNDISLWKKEDYWATPMEMLSIGAGDCEDYSIAKYFTLKQLGVPEEKLRITYVKAVNIGQAHMVLTYFENKRAVPLVLDNLIVDIKPASQRNDLVPVYSFNGGGLWLAKARGSGKRVGEASRLALWQDLEKRMASM